uniref:Uncharacterized protein n=1 Tax=Ochrobactrum phage ORM_20 TaxID=2985243 RepID=A0A9N6WSA0_9VIRU|nr:hypothetical protein ORM20_00235 [Ochrobactrum phage ORM_20]
MEEELLVRYSETGIGHTLSNLTRHRFEFRGHLCFSTEGVLHAVKVNDIEFQKRWIKTDGVTAQRIPARYKPDAWKKTQTLWWMGEPMGRTSNEYREFVKELYFEVSRYSIEYREALIASKGKKLIHPLGPENPKLTVLTRNEFTSALEWCRDKWIV